MEAKDTVMTGRRIDAEMDRIERLDTSYTTAELELCRTQAEITWAAREPEIAEARKAGAREVVEWIEKHSQVESCDPDVMAYFTEYRWVDEAEWQAKPKEWEIKPQRELCKAQRDLTMGERVVIRLNIEDRHFLQAALIALCSEYEDEFPTQYNFARAKAVSVKLGLQTDLLDAMAKAHFSKMPEENEEEVTHAACGDD